MGGKSRKSGQVSKKLIDRLKQGLPPSGKDKPQKKDAPSLFPGDSK